MKKMIEQYREQILYLLFGVVTTVVNILVFQICRMMQMDLYLSNGIAWIISVLTAYVTNKIWVFESKTTELSVLISEVGKFFFARILSLGIDMGCIWLLVDVLKLSDFIGKVASNVVVVVANYFFSKLFVFNK